MGKEALCMGEFGGWMGEGKLLLETDDLLFRGASRLRVPLRELTAVADENGWLVVRHAGGEARFDLGAAAPKWVHAIRNPRTLIDKLGVRPTSRTTVIGIDDDEFLGQLRARTPHVAFAAVPEDTDADQDVIVYRAEEPTALEPLATLRDRIAQDGAIWVVSPRRRPEIADVVVMAAAKRHDLVDVKVARFSETHTALKLMIPKEKRRKER